MPFFLSPKLGPQMLETNVFLVLLLALLYIGIFVVGLTFSIYKTSPVTYQDCSEVQMHKKDNGLYQITISGVTRFVQCKGGATLIQARNPHGGNQAFFFDRSKDEYVEGFGFTSKEFWLGLDMMQKLNNLGNDILRIEGIMHNGSNVYVEFDAFQMVKMMDFRWKRWNEEKTRNLSYPIISMRQTNHSLT